eukprot:8264987-Pyramimonas_sp.AAC.1
MGHAWAIHPRLLCSAGEPSEAPRLRPSARHEGKRSKGWRARERRRRQRALRAQTKKRLNTRKSR